MSDVLHDRFTSPSSVTNGRRYCDLFLLLHFEVDIDSKEDAHERGEKCRYLNTCIRANLVYPVITKVLLNVVRRDDGMREILMPKQYTKNNDEREFVLRLLANRFVSFFHNIIMLVYWDVFCSTMLEELENRGGTPRAELQAWQTLLHIINENMLAGYLDAKQEGRE
ncbi:unnamed protein product [Angiostrongylus costaricensis]|uniref:PXA domain-containing protein n=1 Tax=Angiostrongylus costaricensis TaxID=334426 RepID=A0A158PDT4_ANGCS|nr:unnamed protein product [Angiostrongylus costaricensis]